MGGFVCVGIDLFGGGGGCEEGILCIFNGGGGCVPICVPSYNGCTPPPPVCITPLPSVCAPICTPICTPSPSICTPICTPSPSICTPSTNICTPSTCLPSGCIPSNCVPSTCVTNSGGLCCIGCQYNCIGCSCFGCNCFNCCKGCCTGCCTSCCDCCSCNPKKPKLPKSGHKKTHGGKGGLGGATTTKTSSSSTSSGSLGNSVPFLCGQATELTNLGGNGYKGALEALPLGNIGDKNMPSSGSCLMTMQCKLNEMGQCTGSGLGFKCGSTVDSGQDSGSSSSGCKALSTWKNAFCSKNLNPNFTACSHETLLHGTAKQANYCRSPLPQIHQTIGNASGGLPHKYKSAAPEGHNPEFITGLTGYYACGRGTGQSDDIPAMLHDGDYVMDAETVSALGDGSSKAGREVLEGFRNQIPHHASEGGSAKPVPAKIADGEYVFPSAFVTALGGGDNKRGAEILDGLRTKLRAHKRNAPLDKIPPKAKNPIDYIKKGSK